MARRTKANSGRQDTSGKRRNGPVETESMNAPRDGWTEAEALEMLRAGYEIEHVSERTGFAVRWLRAQPTPRRALALRAAAAKGLASQGKARKP